MVAAIRDRVICGGESRTVLFVLAMTMPDDENDDGGEINRSDSSPTKR